MRALIISLAPPILVSAGLGTMAAIASKDWVYVFILVLILPIPLTVINAIDGIWDDSIGKRWWISLSVVVGVSLFFTWISQELIVFGSFLILIGAPVFLMGLLRRYVFEKYREESTLSKLQVRSLFHGESPQLRISGAPRGKHEEMSEI